MKSWKRRTGLFVSILLTIAMLMAGCAGGKGNSEKAEGTNETGGNAETGETDWTKAKADIRFVYPGTSEAEKELAEQFKSAMKEKYPNVNIEYMYLSWSDMEKKLAVMINSGDYPDIAMTQDVTNLVQLGGLEDLTPYFERDGVQLKREDFLPGTLEYAQIDGKTYAIPNLANSFTLIVNEQMLGEAGMKPEDLKTWADVEKAAELMTKDGKYGFGYPLGVARFAFRVPFTAAYSNDLLLSDTSEASKSKYMETLEHFKKLEPYQPKAHVTWGYPEMFRAYSNGEVGMIAAGTYFTANVYSINPDIVEVSRAIAYPKGPSGTSAKAPVSNVGIAMFKGSENKEIAWKLMEEWSSQEFNSTAASVVNVTAIKSTSLDEIVKKAEKIYPKAIEGHKRILKDFNELLDVSGVPMDTIVGQSEMEVIVQEQLAKYLSGKSTTEEAYEAIKEGIDGVKKKFE
ncbi:extracellular solute-binding protein [Paenibacillus sp. J5C_2022]|uniref:ABC transporter substrate-binding protein n=1 Tax=Paenibacillus sp. J5C2022 TaxID=2977129 RepID=UPI0021CFDD62|nr:extracellular solute-binding protein [Paenibacillus sp. J5C2022]MCU6709831.1 extracellular solute-binding protein [Paenibacillus sp. J5C2022]